MRCYASLSMAGRACFCRTMIRSLPVKGALCSELYFRHREGKIEGAPMPVAPADQSLYELVSAAPPVTIDDVLKRMESIDQLLPDGDGLKCFNRLYMMVTKEVDLRPPVDGWKDADWLLLLDVIFAEFYFGAVAGFLSGASTVPSSWSAMLCARS